MADTDRSWRHMVASGTTISSEAWDQNPSRTRIEPRPGVPRLPIWCPGSYLVSNPWRQAGSERSSVPVPAVSTVPGARSPHRAGQSLDPLEEWFPLDPCPRHLWDGPDRSGAGDGSTLISTARVCWSSEVLQSSVAGLQMESISQTSTDGIGSVEVVRAADVEGAPFARREIARTAVGGNGVTSRPTAVHGQCPAGCRRVVTR